jgi:hypothetical protein
LLDEDEEKLEVKVTNVMWGWNAGVYSVDCCGPMIEGRMEDNGYNVGKKERVSEGEE